FTLTSGNPSAGVNQLYATLFIQDQWRFRPDLLVSAGLRYEAQNEPAFSAGFAPRLGLAYSPDKAQKWVIRARAGIFFNRIDQMLHIQAERLNGMQEQQILINSPSFPDPFASGSANQAIPTIRRLASDLRPSRSLQLQIGFEHQLPHGWRIQMNENWARGWASMLSRNINAPILVSGSGPSTILRPLGIDENLLEFESAGSLKGNVIFVGAQQTSSKLFNLFCGYLYFNFHTNTDGATFLPQNSYNLAAEWARPSWQAAHRAFVVVNFNLPKKIRLSSLLNAASGLPFDVTTGQDNNGDGNFTDRPSFASPGSPASIGTPLGVFDPAAINGNVPRNFGTNPATVDLSMNVSRTFRLAKRSRSGDSTYDLTVNCRASNVLNHPNFTGLSGVVTSPFFAQPNNAGSPRRLEVGMRFSF
ncbi:MAG TPA: TonB-dependent receptor, partial [Blastocatellia bacterium]|nr:TonB-dependent receptor [Blastocatellia bacterium]